MEIRRPTRHPINGRAQVSLPDHTVAAGHTIDVSLGGVSILLNNQIPLGAPCMLRFEMNVKGKIVVITAQTKTVYCVLASHGGFRAGFQFSEEDAERSALIKSLAGRKPVGESTSKEPEPSTTHSATS